MQLTLNVIRGAKGILSCLTFVSLPKECVRASTSLEYWYVAFEEVMPDVTCRGRGRDTESGEGKLTGKNAIVLLSEHWVSVPNGKTRKMTYYV